MIPDRSTGFLIWIMLDRICMTWKESMVLDVLMEDRLFRKACHFMLWLGFIFGATVIL